MYRSLGRLLVFALILPLPGCGGGQEEARDHYTVRGEVVALPSPAQNQLKLMHEEIPDFKDKHGEVKGMMPMTMPFPVDPDVSLAGIEPGDIVEVDFSVSWDPAGYSIHAIRELPEGTELDLDMMDHAGHDHSEHMAGDAAEVAEEAAESMREGHAPESH